MTETELDRFTARFDVADNGCWLWNAGRSKRGYGLFKHNGTIVNAHRFAYNQWVEPVPPGLDLDHLCHTLECVNPDHLEPVTHRENVRRGRLGATSRTRQLAKTHCPRGHPYAGDNLGYQSKGSRVCILCRRITANIRYAKTKGLVKS